MSDIKEHMFFDPSIYSCDVNKFNEIELTIKHSKNESTDVIIHKDDVIVMARHYGLSDGEEHF